MAHPFTIAVDPTSLADLQTRLSNTRWPDQVDNTKWKLGTDKTFLQQLCSYWGSSSNGILLANSN